MKSFYCIVTLSLLVSTGAFASGKYKALGVPTNVRVTSSEPRKIVWGALSEKEKNLAVHLLAAANAGRTIVYNQNHRHALAIKAMLEAALRAENVEGTKSLLGDAGFHEFLNYSAKFEDLMGPYESSNRKYYLRQVSAEQLTELFKRALPKQLEQDRSEAVRLLTDPDYEVISQPEDENGTDLENAGGNLYEHGLSGAEVKAALQAGLKSDLNCRIVRGDSGTLECEKQALSNSKLQPEVRDAMTKIVAELELALPFASSEHQTSQLKHLIEYFKTGDVEEFRQMNVEWVRDGTSSKVDFMMGYVEVYQDYLNKIGAWESYVQIVDPVTTQMSVSLAHNAQGFENDMPYGKYKKLFPADYSPPALMVYYFQELSSFHSGGYNLPNFDDIRRDVGAKNIIRLDLPGQDTDPVTLNVRRELFTEFSPAAKVDDILANWPKARRAMVLLHEIIGHGSGTYNTEKYGAKEDPVGALGALGSALEEQRADLTALVFSADPKLVQIGFYADAEEALRTRNSMYDNYLGSFLNSVSKQQSLTEAHQRGHWLLINLLVQGGAVEKVSRDGASPVTDENFVLAVKDYEKYHQICYDLLAKLQDIKAERKDADLKGLFTQYAPLDEINAPWLQAVIKRGQRLRVNSGAIEQPWEVLSGEVRVFGDPSLEGIAPFLGN